MFLEFQPRNLRAIRDRTLVAVAYDAMCRREELVSLVVEDGAPKQSEISQPVPGDWARLEARNSRATIIRKVRNAHL